MKREREIFVYIYKLYIYIEDDRKCVTWGRKTLKVLYICSSLTIFFIVMIYLTNYIIFILERELEYSFDFS